MNKNIANFLPLGEKVLIEVKEDDSISGFIIPVTFENQNCLIGIVRAIGSPNNLKGEPQIDPKIKVDSVVLFNKAYGNKIKEDNKLYYLMDAKDILGVMKENI